MTRTSKKAISILLLLSLSGMAEIYAKTEASVNANNQAEITDDGLGVELKFDPDGNLLSLKSTYSHPVDFPDRRGISKAYIIAEEKAKANIARYLNQTTSTSRVVNDLDSSVGSASKSKSSAGETWTKENTRKVAESLQEITTSGASAVLRGVRIISKAYDEKSEEVTVIVGINKKSINGANQLGGFLSPMNKSGDNAAGTRNDFPSVGSERKRAKDAGDF